MKQVHAVRLASIACLTLGGFGASLCVGAAAKGTTDPGIAWVPPRAQLVLRVRYADMRGSELFRSLMSARPLFREELTHMDRFAACARIDPAKTFESAVVATDGATRGQSVAVVSGRLDPGLGERLAAGGAARRKTDSGLELYVLPARASNARASSRASTPVETVVAFPAASTMLVGTRAWVEASAQQGRGGGGAAAGAPAGGDLGSLLKRVDDGASLWTVAGPSAVAAKVRSEMNGRAADTGAFEGIRNVVASFRITNVVRLDTEATAVSDDDADTLAMTLRGLIAVAGLKSSFSDPDLADALRGLAVDRTGAGVRLSGTIPGPIARRL